MWSWVHKLAHMRARTCCVVPCTARFPGTDADMDPDAPPPKATPFNTYKVDMWALGATVYAYLFGCLPFGFTTVLDLCDAILHKECVASLVKLFFVSLVFVWADSYFAFTLL